MTTKSEVQLPCHVIGLAVAPFLDRVTMNSLALASKEMTHSLQTITRPWPSNVRLKNERSQQWLAFSPDGSTLISRDRIGRITLSRRVDGVQTMFGDALKCSHLSDISYSPDGKRVTFVGEDGNINLLSLKDGSNEIVSKETDGASCSVCFSPDGQTLLSGGFDSTIRVWRISDHRCIKTLRGHTGCVYSVIYSPDGSMLASAGTDGNVRIWDVETGAVEILKGHSLVIPALAFSPDGQCLASGSLDSTVRIWNLSKLKCVQIFTASSDPLHLSFSKDGKLIACGLATGTVVLLDVKDAHPAKTISGGIAAFDPDGSILATGWNGEEIRLLSVPN